MQLALECPTSYLHRINPLTDFNFLLAHLVLEDPLYLQYFQSMEGNRFTVLDNSVNELGKPCSIKDMQKAAEFIKPNKIIPPESLKKGIDLWGHSKIIPVIQGINLEDVYRCAKVTIGELGFKTISLPYDITLGKTHSLSQLATSRQRIVIHLMEEYPGLKIHLLGFNTFEEIDFYKDYSNNVVSIDTGSPYTNSTNGVIFAFNKELIPKGIYIDYKDEYTILGEAHVCHNIAYMRQRFNSVGERLNDDA